MTIKYVEEFLAKIQYHLSKENYEAAHIEEDQLYEFVLRTISLGDEDAVVAATLALTTKTFKFPRVHG